MLDAQGKRGADVPNGSFGDSAKARGVGPSFPPVREATVGWRFPRVHPNGKNREKSLVRREFPSAFSEARVWHMKEGFWDGASALHSA